MRNVIPLLLITLVFPVAAAQAQQPRQSARIAAVPEAASTVSPDEGNVAPFFVSPGSEAQIRQVLTSSQRGKLHPYFQGVVAWATLNPGRSRSAVQSVQRHPGVTVGPAQQAYYGAIVRTNRPAAIRGTGVHVNSRYEGFVTIRATAQQLGEIATLQSVAYVSPGSINYPTNDRGVVETGANLLHDGYIENTPLTGEGAIVCVYDTGLDFSHDDFIDENGDTRVLSLWDQTISPQAGESNPSGFNYGVEYSQSDVNDEIHGMTSGAVREQDLEGHGTHVAGTAAGDGSAYNGIYAGMAPRADLVIVKGGNGSFSEANIIDGLTYCDRQAEAAGEPVVVNLSLGGHIGPHDGTRPYEQAIDQFGATGSSNSRQGRAVAVANGNEGNTPIHISGTVAPHDTVSFNVPSNYTPETGASNDFFVFDSWFAGVPNVEATVISPPIYDTDGDMTPDSSVSFTLSSGNQGSAPSDTAGTIYLFNAQNSQVGTNDLNVFMQIYDGSAANAPAAGEWKLVYDATAGSATYDGWLGATSSSLAETTLEDGDVQSTVGMPATSEEALSTGAYNSKLFWPTAGGSTFGVSSFQKGAIASFSSRGPTRDGRIKPELSAPGLFIISSKSKYVPVQNNPSVVPGQKHFRLQGTSMASPHVAGAAALILGEFPNKTAPDLRALFKDNADTDGFTGMTPNNTWGSGKLDVFRAMVKEKGGTQAERDRYAYAGAPGFFTTLTGDRRFALQFTPTASGILTGFDVSVALQGSIPAVKGSGDLLYQLYTDDGSGLPGQAMTDTLHKGFAEIPASTVNYFSMLNAAPDSLGVQAGQDYHVVFYTENADDTLQVRVSDTRSSTQPHSAVYDGSTWQESDTYYSAPRAFCTTPIVTRSSGLDILPVEMVAFDAVAEGRDVVLRWHTASEQSNRGFYVEHAVGKHGAFEQAGFVKGAGTTDEAQSYTHRLTDLAPGVHRFRLRQVDHDGTPSFSSVVQLDRGVKGTHELSAIYPNPARGNAQFKLAVSEKQKVRVEVFDVLGRRVSTLHDGWLPADEPHTFTLNGSNLPSGLYVVRTTSDRFTETQRVTLVK